MPTQVTFQNNLTREDCRRKGFSGIRQDTLLKQTEIWVMGTLAKEISELAMAMDPQNLLKIKPQNLLLNLDPAQ